MRLTDLAVRTRIMIGSVLPMILILIMAVIGIKTARELGTVIRLTSQTETLIRQAMTIERDAADMENSIRGHLLAGDEDSLVQYKSAVAGIQKAFKQLKIAVRERPEQVKLLGRAEEALKTWQTAVEHREKPKESTTVSELNAGKFNKEARKYFGDFRKNMAAFEKKEQALLTYHQKSVFSKSPILEPAIISVVVVSILLTLMISYYLASTIVRPLSQAASLAESISKSDLSRRVEIEGNDEVSRLGSALNDMSDNLKDQLSQILEGVSILSTLAEEISTTATELYSSTSATTSAVTETSSTVEQVKQATQISSGKAKSVADVSQRAVKTSDSGKQATQDTIAGMSLIKEQMESIGETVVRLSEHSQAIEEIIGAVQDLANQSNLLAVNASIEAARAGDQGKGFAVVANEIKTLADQSREATDQVRTILEDTRKWVSAVVMATEQGNKAVEAGVGQSARAGEAIQALANSVLESSQAATVIETSTDQQYVGVDQVVTAMTTIETSMKQTVDASSHLESAATRLNDLGGQLRRVVEQYQV